MHSDQRLLHRLQSGPVSGAALAAELGISRAAVWKRIEALRAMGLQIKARSGHGYGLESPPEWLNADAIAAALPAVLRDELAQLDVVWSLPSTNTALLTAPLPDAGCRVLLAEHQSGGRGRHGRAWVSPLGGQLAVSVLRGFDGGLARLGGLSLVAGIAVAEALHAAGYGEVRLKWPNDVLLDGAKLTGILVERHPLPQGNSATIIGIGINVVQAPSQADYAVTSLHARGFAFTPQQIFMVLSKAWSVNFDLWDKGRGFVHIREKWLRFAAGLGEKISVQMPGQRVSGWFKTIDAAGQLVIETSDNVQVRISAGDVHFGDAGTWRPAPTWRSKV